MFIYKCALCLRALLDEGDMCGPCAEALEAFGPSDAKARIDKMCTHTLEGMDKKIPIESIYAPAKYPTLVGKWYAAVAWICELNTRATIKIMIARRKSNYGRGSLDAQDYTDPDGPSDGWKEPDGDDWIGGTCA